MSALRVSLVVIQALANHWACTPPNPTSEKSRYHKEELYILQIAPLIFKIHMTILWICALFEILFYSSTLVPSTSLSPIASAVICPQTSDPRIRVTPMFMIGIVAVVLGSYIRLDCFRTLGQLFTFDLTIHPEHKLVTSRFYSYVRHPAYTGSMLLIAGLSFSHLMEGSWLTECGPLRPSSSAVIVCALWWLWTLAVGVSRAEAEDRQMQKLFADEWDKYASNVPWWFFPGLA
ncbi:hypothetical protein GYMLUDRAFT_174366 [Collybiopsis luxurians FD-317 M1]|uniref:Protein-S-isoprenylcysteine O-methyltransferase n=1 Tax=Collybiopsis luxurians FD-317 M1 TaxID=944289 RepID=A0A0D0BN05_9AGAR|nr:hypothetical protein GYMLUDRAFT_174366 [Collybiopsis luxurians FD-317 M1]